jgi:hypothetical protein
MSHGPGRLQREIIDVIERLRRRDGRPVSFADLRAGLVAGRGHSLTQSEERGAWRALKGLIDVDEVIIEGSPNQPRRYFLNGQKTIAALAREHGINLATLHKRIESGWSLKRALETPPAPSPFDAVPRSSVRSKKFGITPVQ